MEGGVSGNTIHLWPETVQWTKKRMKDGQEVRTDGNIQGDTGLCKRKIRISAKDMLDRAHEGNLRITR